MSTKLSFVVPVHNVGYSKLNRCLTSIVKCMKLMRSSSELIIVNDASERWNEEQVSVNELLGDAKFNYTLINLDVNVGLGAARNRGFKEVTGKYVWFVDSDDDVRPKRLLDLLSYLKKCPEVDIFQINALKVSLEGKSDWMYFNSSEEMTLTGRKALDAVKTIPPCVWSKVYKTEFLRKHNLQNPEGVLYEDQSFLVSTMLAKPKVKVIPVTLYRYWESEGSITNTWDVRHAVDLARSVIESKALLRDAGLKDSERYSEYDWNLNQLREKSAGMDFWTKVEVTLAIYNIWMSKCNCKGLNKIKSAWRALTILKK